MQENSPHNSTSLRLHKLFSLLKTPGKLLTRIKIKLFDADLKKKSFRDQYFSSKRALQTLALLAVDQVPVLKVQSLEDCGFAARETDDDAIRLKDMFLEFGSDKSGIHNYHLLYAGLLRNHNAELSIFEMGLGTQHLEMISNMGPEGKPGASLRAFKEMYPHAFIYGADIDKRILFDENRIKTFYASQLDMDSLIALQCQLSPVKFHLMIDDGLHTPEANINTLRFAIDLLAPEGVFVIEDIKESDIDFFLVTGGLLHSSFDFSIVKTQAAYVCVIKKKQSNRA